MVRISSGVDKEWRRRLMQVKVLSLNLIYKVQTCEAN